MKKITMSFPVAWAKAAAVCSLSEKCEQDIRSIIAQWDLSRENTEKIVEQLKRENFLNEKRFARCFAQDKVKYTKWGKNKIIYALKEKGICTEYISEAIEQIDSEMYENMLEKQLQYKLKIIKYKDTYEAKAKLYRFGIGKGFENEILVKKIDKVLNESLKNDSVSEKE